MATGEDTDKSMLSGSSRCSSPEITMQNETEDHLNLDLSVSRSHHHGSKSRKHIDLPRSSQHTPHFKRRKELNPSKLLACDNCGSSDSDEEGARQYLKQLPKRRKQHSVDDDKENSSEIGDIKAILLSLCKKVDENSRALKEIKQQQHSGSVSSSSGGSPKRIIPLNVRKEVRSCYKVLLDDDEDGDFLGWCIEPGVSIKSDENQSVIQRLIKEVRGLNPTFDAADIREAAYRFYKTKCEEESLKRTGKDVEKKRSRRRHERITRKRKEREAAILKNTKLTEDQKKKWLQVITNDFMSSEESGEDDSIMIHPLPWRSEYVNKMFKKIDAYCGHKKSPQALRQMKRRESGCTSSRLQPVVDELVSKWAIA